MTSNSQLGQAIVNPSVERLSQLAKTVLDRLERDEPLSAILPQARLVAELKGDKAQVHWIDLETYGVGQIPLRRGASARRAQDDSEQVGVLLFAELHSVQDYTSISLRKVERDWGGERIVERTKIAPQSVSELEESTHRQPLAPSALNSEDMADRVLQLDAAHSEQKFVLKRVRAYLYKYVSAVWTWALEEIENQKLLGRDYRIVVANLDALESECGQELRAALKNLQSDNPAEWSLAALACRNVVLKLGRILFPAKIEQYQSALAGKALELKGEKELNRLSAFIDVYWKKASEEDKKQLQELDEVARHIYGKGSQGKRKTTLAEVQSLVKETFRLVSQLGKLTALEPILTVTNP